MRSIVNRPGALSEILFPRPDHHHTASAVPVLGAEKGMEIILAPIQRSVIQRFLTHPTPLEKSLPVKMECLTIPFSRMVIPIEKPCYPRNPCDSGEYPEEDRSVQGRRDEKMWITFDCHRMDGSQALPYHKIRLRLFNPGSQLPGRHLGIKVVSPYDYAIFRTKNVLENRRDAAVTSTSHAVDIEDGLRILHFVQNDSRYDRRNYRGRRRG